MSLPRNRKILQAPPSEFSIFPIQVTTLATNCYLIIHNHSNKCLIIDPGGESQKIIDHIKKKDVFPLAIIATHAHFDHIMAVNDLKEKYQIPFYLHREDQDTLQNSSNLSLRFISKSFTLPLVDHYFQDNKFSPRTIKPFKFRTILTPGHTPGSICLEFNQTNQKTNNNKKNIYLFTGDTLFAENQVGRTDLPGGSSSDLHFSLQKINRYLENIKTNKNKITLLPGHGPSCNYT